MPKKPQTVIQALSEASGASPKSVGNWLSRKRGKEGIRETLLSFLITHPKKDAEKI